MKKLKSLLQWQADKPLAEKDPFSADEKILQAVRSQEMQTPSPHVLIRLLDEVGRPPKQFWLSQPWLWGIPMMMLIFSLLWLVLQPGNQLQWVAVGSQPATFRIYRAPARTMAFELIEELPANPHQQTYQYADALVFPGLTYQYRIEVRDQRGNTISSSTAISNAWMTSATQIAILLTGFMLTFGIITIVEEIKPSAQLNLLV